ncbi:Mysoin-binding motif of peroxisomes-domain-containing protein [Apodospora peruviana]|uniref:Vezatin n=1 Tax=Apodospora peruviana TaxID=516989 RepID=A0AAE0IQU5_9PEZI|nr:Mysoin-binding motif of peroxisomes-domain-containing protein [Apodospora peruviana]
MADQGEEEHETWDTSSHSERLDDDHEHSPPSSPSFAPVGRPVVRKRFRSNIPDPLRLDVPHMHRLSSLHNTYSKAVASRIDRADNLKFIEKFRYTIVASQLLSSHSVTGQQNYYHQPRETLASTHDARVPTSTGLLVTAAGALVVAWIISWVYSGGYSHLTKKRVIFAVVVFVATVLLAHVYIRQQWLRYLRDQALAEVTTFVSRSQDFDSASSAALSLIQEVELVSRGYRLSAPLPPISRIEDRSQTRRCRRLRKVLRGRITEMIKTCIQVSTVVKGFSEQLDLEKYYDVYDIGDLDISDALRGFSESELEDAESLRVLKIAAARFHTVRRIFLCALLAFEATGDNTDFLRWSTAVEGLRTLNDVTGDCYEKLRLILSEEESEWFYTIDDNVAQLTLIAFPSVSDSKMPLSPGRERRRNQFTKLNSLSTGIRGLQAKLALLREESERTLNEAEDVSELGANMMAQYESIGQDLKLLTQAWEEGKAALASGINRNEKRLSSISALLSPASSMSGLTTVEEGGALEAFKALTGESPPSSAIGSTRGDSDEAEVFEAVAIARPRSLLTREERITRMKEERERKEITREKVESTRGMLRELEMVINLRPKRSNTTSAMPAPGRISI